MLTDGLRFSGLFSFKNVTLSNVERVANYNRYYVTSYDPNSLDYEISRIGEERDTSLKTTGTYGGERKMYFQAVLDYNRILVSGMILEPCYYITISSIIRICQLICILLCRKENKDLQVVCLMYMIVDI